MRARAAVLCLAAGCASSASVAPLSEQGDYVEPPASDAVLRAEELLSAGVHAEAAKQLEQALRENPRDARAWLDLGLAREGLGQAKRAEDAYRRAAELEPEFAEAFNNLGVVLREWGSLDDAIVALERAVRLKPALVDAQLNLAMAYEDRGSLEQARDAYAKVIKLSPEDPIPRIYQGLLHLEMDRLDQARTVLLSARKLARGDADLLTSIGGGLRRAKAPSAALATLHEAREAVPGDPGAALLGELALAYYAKGQFDHAEKTMKQALEQRPNDDGLSYAYATMLIKNGKLDEGRARLRELANDPKSRWADRAKARLEAIEQVPVKE